MPDAGEALLLRAGADAPLAVDERGCGVVPLPVDAEDPHAFLPGRLREMKGYGRQVNAGRISDR
jgi:hypothetical protein